MTKNPYESPDGDNEETQKNPGRLLINGFMILSIAAVLASYFLPVSRGRQAARRTVCRNNLKQIMLAMHNYSDVYGGFPPAYTINEQGQPLHSWRTLILPFVGEESLYNSIDLSKPWDDPTNAELKMPTVYQCPSAVLPAGHTTYLAMVGDSRFLHPTESRKISEISDGTSNTLSVLDVPVADSVLWMAPDDTDGLPLFALSEDTEVSHSGVMMTARADGSVQTIWTATSISDRRALMTIDAEDTVSEY